MKRKELTIVLRGVTFASDHWRYPFDPAAVGRLVEECRAEFAPLGIELRLEQQLEDCVQVRGYGDLLNAVRILSPADGLGNLCLGHILGSSADCDLLADVRRGISRVAFAPEMVEPEGIFKKVCHNCGCGC